MKRIIYGLYHPITKVPVYVGKTSKGLERVWNHINEKSHSKKVNDWILELKENRLVPIVVVLDQSESDEVLSKKEIFWINSLINDGYPLLNQLLVNPIYFSIKSSYIDDDYLNEIRFFVKSKRRQLKLTQDDISKKAGVGLRFIRELEQGNKTNFNTDTLHKILKILGAKLTVS